MAAGARYSTSTDETMPECSSSLAAAATAAPATA